MIRVGTRSDLGRPVLTSRHYTWLAVGFLALVIYGSLVPFHYQPLPWREALIRYRAAMAAPVRLESRSDWLANILLFIPLSYLLMAALCVDRSRRTALLGALVVLPSCAALSAAVEFTQLFFPPRVTSINDVAAESLGAALGAALWLAGGQRITVWGRRIGGGLGIEGQATRLLWGYLAFLFLIQTFPFDLTLSPVELYRKYRDGRVQLIPFAGFHGTGFEMVQKHLMNAVYFLPVGLLLAERRGRFWSQPASWPRVLGLGVLLAGLVEFLQLFVLSRFCDTTDALTGGLGVLAGWAFRLQYRRAAEALPAGARHQPAADRFGPRPGQRRLRSMLVAGWIGVLIFVNWQPFNFTAPPGVVSRRLAEMSWIPFADYYQGEYLNSYDQIVHKVLLFLLLGVLLTPNPRTANWKRAGPGVVLWGGLLALVLETGQCFLPTRYPSVTDVLIETFGAWLGFVVVRLAYRGHTAGWSSG